MRLPDGRARHTVIALGAAAVVVLASHAWTWLFAPAHAESRHRIRVLLRSDVARLVVEGSRITAKPAAPHALGTRTEVRTQSSGLLVLDQQTGAVWVHDSNTLELAWQGAAKLRLFDAAGHESTARQIGRIAIEKRGSNLRAVLHCDVEIYVTGVLAAELGARFPLEALEAQAVAARSFAWSARARRRALTFDVYADDRDQVFRGPSENPSILAAVRATRGEFVLFDGKPLRAYYSSTCGGRTRDGRERFRDVAAGPLRSVVCDACLGSPLYRWTRSVPAGKLAAIGITAAPASYRIEATRKSERGDWIEFEVRAPNRAPQSYDVAALRQLAALPSPWITKVRLDAGGLELEGRGFGHGVGLCQYGAAGRARAGRSYRQILAHYYPGTRVGRIPD